MSTDDIDSLQWRNDISLLISKNDKSYDKICSATDLTITLYNLEWENDVFKIKRRDLQKQTFSNSTTKKSAFSTSTERCCRSESSKRDDVYLSVVSDRSPKSVLFSSFEITVPRTVSRKTPKKHESTIAQAQWANDFSYFFASLLRDSSRRPYGPRRRTWEEFMCVKWLRHKRISISSKYECRKIRENILKLCNCFDDVKCKDKVSLFLQDFKESQTIQVNTQIFLFSYFDLFEFHHIGIQSTVPGSYCIHIISKQSGLWCMCVWYVVLCDSLRDWIWFSVIRHCHDGSTHYHQNLKDRNFSVGLDRRAHVHHSIKSARDKQLFLTLSYLLTVQKN